VCLLYSSPADMVQLCDCIHLCSSFGKLQCSSCETADVVSVVQMYEKAAPFFELAAQVQPQEVKWQLMVASCFRRTGNQQQVCAACFCHFTCSVCCEERAVGELFSSSK